MAKPALIIDMLAGPGDDEDGDEETPPDAATDGAQKGDPEVLISDIKSQLDRLQGLYRQLG